MEKKLVKFLDKDSVEVGNYKRYDSQVENVQLHLTMLKMTFLSEIRVIENIIVFMKKCIFRQYESI